MTSESPASRHLLEVNNLRVSFPIRAGTVEAVKDLSFHVDRGETLCLVGESGSGKSVTAMTIMRLLDYSGGRIESGQILFSGRSGSSRLDLGAQAQREMCSIRGNEIAMIFQEPMTSLNPVKRIGDQLVEGLIAHKSLSQDAARARAIELLDAVRVPESARRITQYPHELSGGMRQRVMIAMALSCEPTLLIADEPTTALDVSVQSEILALFRELQERTNTAVLFITHDMGVVAEIADRVVVMRHGRKVEEADVQSVFSNPTHAYTKSLLAAVPKLGAMREFSSPQKFTLLGDQADQLPEKKDPSADLLSTTPTPLLEVSNLIVRYPLKQGLLRRTFANVHAVEGVSFTLNKGETLGVVGESGCGKSTLGRAVLRLIEPTSGSIRIDGSDLMNSGSEDLRQLRRRMQMVFQDAGAALNPKLVAFDQVAEPLENFGGGSVLERRDLIANLFHRVGLARDHLDRYPHEFSGGQRQRLCIARALSVSPSLIVADESVSALDVSVQAQVLNLMLDLQDELGLSYLFISHDMAVVERVSHRVAVMYAGRIVEIGPRTSVFDNPQHEYTQRLLAAVPIPDPAIRPDRTTNYHPLPNPVYPAGTPIEPTLYRDLGAGHLVAENYQMASGSA